MKGAVGILLLFCVVGCATQPRKTEENYAALMQSYIGVTEENLVAEWGIPTTNYELNKIRYLVYDKSETFNYAGTAPVYIASPDGAFFPMGGRRPYSVTYSCKTTFVIEKGKVKDVTFKGNDCVY